MILPAAGVEPATFRSGGERSNPLSYAGLTIVGFKEVDKKCTHHCIARQWTGSFCLRVTANQTALSQPASRRS
jgi:hypothetical protein